MKYNILITTVLLAIALACNNLPVDAPYDGQEVKTVNLQLSEYEGDPLDSKTSYDSGNDKFLWAEGDAVGIVSTEGNQLKFPIRQEYWGQAYARFDGRGFALLSNQSYSSYYPFVADYDLDVTALPITYVGQHQSGDDSMDGLGAFAYTAAQGSAPEQGTLNFIFRNIGSAHRYRMPVTAGAYKNFRLSIPTEKYIESGTINLFAASETELISITPTAITDHLDLDMQGTSMASVGPLRCWMMLPPVDLTGDVIRLELTSEDGLVSDRSVAAFAADAGLVFNLGSVSVLAGASTIGFRNITAEFGIGLRF